MSIVSRGYLVKTSEREVVKVYKRKFLALNKLAKIAEKKKDFFQKQGNNIEMDISERRLHAEITLPGSIWGKWVLWSGDVFCVTIEDIEIPPSHKSKG